MKKLKNKFIIGVILLICVVVFSQVYKSYSSVDFDTNTYVSLVKGKATVNDLFIAIDNREVLIPGDIVRTIGGESLAVVEWGDGSVTRLGGNTKISVGNNEVSRDYTKIDISFDLIAGKTWSQIVSFISNDSSFTQTFAGVEAGVRGTVFDVDLEQGYVYVTDHKISLTNLAGDVYELGEEVPFSFTDFSLINITEFFGNLYDSGWSEINKELDQKRLGLLKKEIEQHLSSHNPFLFLLEIFSPKYRFIYELDHDADFNKLQEILQNLSESQRKDVYTTVLSRYQKLNFITSEDVENYNKKLLYKRLLILLSDQKDKEILLETTLYDFKNTISTENIPAFDATMELLRENTETLKNIDTDEILGDIDLIPNGLEEVLIESLGGLGEFLEGGLPDASNINLQTGQDVFKDTKKQAEEGIEKGLDTLFNSFSN